MLVYVEYLIYENNPYIGEDNTRVYNRSTDNDPFPESDLVHQIMRITVGCFTGIESSPTLDIPINGCTDNDPFPESDLVHQIKRTVCYMSVL